MIRNKQCKALYSLKLHSRLDEAQPEDAYVAAAAGLGRGASPAGTKAPKIYLCLRS